MSQPARAHGKGKRKGKNTHGEPSPSPPNPSLSISNVASAPSVGSGAVGGHDNPVLLRQQAQEKKYPLWKYVTRKSGPGAKLGGEGMWFGHATFARMSSKAHITG